MEFRFFCRQDNSSEDYPLNANGTEYSAADPVVVPTTKQPNIRGGCFGTGPSECTFITHYFSFQIFKFV